MSEARHDSQITLVVAVVAYILPEQSQCGLIRYR